MCSLPNRVILGPPGIGKSAFIFDAARDIARERKMLYCEYDEILMKGLTEEEILKRLEKSCIDYSKEKEDINCDAEPYKCRPSFKDFNDYLKQLEDNGVLVYDLRLAEVDISTLTGIPTVLADVLYTMVQLIGHAISAVRPLIEGKEEEIQKRIGRQICVPLPGFTFEPPRWVEMVKRAKIGVVRLDELTNVRDPTRLTAAYALTLEGRIGNIKINKPVIATGNTQNWSNIAHVLPHPLRTGRLAIDLFDETDVQNHSYVWSWKAYMDRKFDEEWDKTVFTYLFASPNRIIAQPTEAERAEESGMKAFPTPRAWTRLATALYQVRQYLDKADLTYEEKRAYLEHLINSIVGEQAGREFLFLAIVGIEPIQDYVKKIERTDDKIKVEMREELTDFIENYIKASGEFTISDEAYARWVSFVYGSLVLGAENLVKKKELIEDRCSTATSEDELKMCAATLCTLSMIKSKSEPRLNQLLNTIISKDMVERYGYRGADVDKIKLSFVENIKSSFVQGNVCYIDIKEEAKKPKESRKLW